ncbi:MAG: hypothetical protein CVV53_07105 [Spirochaetae bacterium HGW-Spirochaetae-9]|nr:MAG: hypothetical protein CVV53_07105 [Spirochaetae bacterium HGW-Spirochaetae-9]
MNRKIIAFLAIFALAGSAVFAQTATKYFVAHQGGYVGAATVTVGKSGEVVSASLEEWQGPGGWAENNSADGKSIVDGAIVRTPDPFANLTNKDPEIKGYMFYILNQAAGGPGVWSQYTPGAEKFARPARQYERDFEGLMSNPLRAAAYVKAAREDKLVNVKIDGLKVTVGKKASQTVHYGAMDKADKNATYMPLTKDSIGYRYNNLATLDFFKANPTADFGAATLQKVRIAVLENKAVDAGAKAADYVAAEDNVYVVADAVTGATYSDFQHYSLELQMAYKMAIADALVKF